MRSPTVSVVILWDEAAVAEMRSVYLQHSEMEWANSHWSPARHLVQMGLMGELHIAVNGKQLFVEPYEVVRIPGGSNVLGLLLGLRLALDRVFELGAQGVRMWPDWMLLLVDSDSAGQVSVSSPSGNVLTTSAAEWRRGIDAGLDECRSFLHQHLPELRDDPFLGAWMNGSEPVFFEGTCTTRSTTAS